LIYIETKKEENNKKRKTNKKVDRPGKDK